MSTEQKTIVKIGADIKEFEDKINAVSGKLKDLGGKFSDVGKDLTAKVTLPIVGLGVGAVTMAANFEQGMSKVKAISGATGADFDALKNQAKELGASTSFSASEAAEGMQNLASAGFETKEIMAAMPGMLDLAASGDVDLATASDYASSALRGFGLEADKATHVADIFAKTASATNAGVTDMGEAMKYVAPVAKTLGISIEETASAIGELSNAGIKGSMAGTTLRTALTSLASPSKEAAGLMQQLGINAFDSQGKMKPLGDVIGTMNDKFKNLTQQQKAHALETIFGKEAMSGMMVLVDQGKGKFDELTNSLQKSDGAAKSMADTMKDNLNGKIDELKGKLETLGINLGEILIPKIEIVIDHINKLVDKFSSLSPATQETIMAIAGVAAVIPILITVIGSLIGFVGKVTAIFGEIALAVEGAGEALAVLTSPITIVIAAIVALVASFVYLYNTNEEFRDKVNGVWSQIQALAEQIFGYLKAFWEQWGDDIKAIFQGLSDIISVILNLIVDAFKIAFPFISSVVKSAVDAISGILGGLIEIIRGVVDFISGVLTGDWDKAWKGIKEIFSGIWDSMGAIVEGAAKIIGGIIDGIVGSIKEALSWVAKLLTGKSEADKAKSDLASSSSNSSGGTSTSSGSNLSNNFDNISWHATGGMFSKPSIIGVGEDTGVDEAVIPMSGTHMKPFAETIASLIGGGNKGVSISQTFNNTGELSPSEVKARSLEAGRQLTVEWGI